MRVGVPKEIKPSEQRVALTPAGAQRLVAAGHEVVVERGAGVGSGFTDDDYRSRGAVVLSERADVWGLANLVLKVKEPRAIEYCFLREDLTLFTYLHLAPNRELTEALQRSGTTAVAYETVEDADGALPLLAPMSEIAGRLAAQAGAFFLQSPHGGNGTLIGGAPGVRPARVLVLGGGVVGAQAARVCAGMGAEVIILERLIDRVRLLEERFAGRAMVLLSDPLALSEELERADLVIGAVLVPGATAPRLIERAALTRMRRRAVLVDVAIDQGGVAETSKPTTHERPTYDVDGVLHYCVANMPAAVPATSTRALTNVTLPYVLALADGVERAMEIDTGLARGLNLRAGEIVYQPVAEARARDAAPA